MRTAKEMFRRLATVIALIPSLAAGGTVTYFHNDLAGSPVAATNSSGQIVWKEQYRPYGERLVNSPASADNEVWFTSRRQDVDTGLVYMGARYYDPVAGRFLSIDPSLFNENSVHSHNRYTYANNNPQRYVDPDGRNPILIAMGVGALIGGGVNAVSQYVSTGTIRWQGIGGVIDAAGDGMLLGLAGARSGAGASESLGAAEAKAAGTTAEAAKRAAIDANKLNHIFGQTEHNLQGVVAHYGSREKAFEALKSATEAAIKTSGTNGVFETTVQAGGANVTVRGVVVDGTVKIGTAFVP